MAEVCTSASHPIYVDWLPARGPGRVGLTLAPGKHQYGYWSGIEWRRDLAADLDELQGNPAIAVDTLVCLIEPHELDALQIPDYHAQVGARGIELLEFPIVDGDVPRDRPAFARLVREVDTRVRAGRSVVVHCAGGLGRSGTLGGCLLVLQGFSPDDALAALVAARGPKCPEREAQRDYIRAFAAHSSPER